MSSATPRKATRLPVPNIAVSNQTVKSLDADDVYFSADDGLRETRHVFLKGNDLPKRWVGRLRFSIGEIGFGTGLNFLTTWREFEETVIEPDARLFYISTERAPLSEKQLEKALGLFPELSEYADALKARYPIRVPGWHRIAFDRVVLWLGYGESADLLSEFEAKIDAWYLDGFAPAKNPEAWDRELFKQVERLSEADASVATFSAASSVNHALTAHGFEPEKIAGYGKKRDMLIAKRKGVRDRFSFAVPQVAIIGGGIAGAAASHTLACRGAQTSLFEAGNLATGASGNPAAVLFPRINKQFNPMMQESFLGYAHTLRELNALDAYNKGWAQQTGMLKYPKSLEERNRLFSINEDLGIDESVLRWITYESASEKTGLELSDGGVFYPHGSWVKPADFVRAYAAHERVRINEQARIEDVTHYGDGYLIQMEDAACAATHLIIANAAGALNYHISEHLPLRISAGQLSLLPKDSTTSELKTLFCHKGYTIPQEDHYVIGATYDHDDLALSIRPDHHRLNLESLMFYAPGFVYGRPELQEGRVSHRVSAPNHAPITGPLMDADGTPVPYAYTSLGHGSRGMISAPLAADKIAAQIYDEPRPTSWL